VKHPVFGRGVCRIFFRQMSLSSLVGCGLVDSWDVVGFAVDGGGVGVGGPCALVVADGAKGALTETSAAKTLA
jgi:hypothetical protein